MVCHKGYLPQAAEATAHAAFGRARYRNPNYSIPVTLAIRRSETMAISSVPWM